jgi:hypothetical protein
MIPDKTGTIGSTQGVIESNNPDIKNPNKIKNILSFLKFCSTKLFCIALDLFPSS